MGTQAGATTSLDLSPEVDRHLEEAPRPQRSASAWSVGDVTPVAATVLTFAILFAKPLYLLVHDWWTLPEAGHGLLLGPVAVWLAWRSGIRPDAQANRLLGVLLLVLAVLVRFAAGLAAELFTMRASIVMALGGLTIYHFGFRQ